MVKFESEPGFIEGKKVELKLWVTPSLKMKKLTRTDINIKGKHDCEKIKIKK